MGAPCSHSCPTFHSPSPAALQTSSLQWCESCPSQVAALPCCDAGLEQGAKPPDSANLKCPKPWQACGFLPPHTSAARRRWAGSIVLTPTPPSQPAAILFIADAASYGNNFMLISSIYNSKKWFGGIIVTKYHSWLCCFSCMLLIILHLK